MEAGGLDCASAPGPGHSFAHPLLPACGCHLRSRDGRLGHGRNYCIINQIRVMKHNATCYFHMIHLNKMLAIIEHGSKLKESSVTNRELRDFSST